MVSSFSTRLLELSSVCDPIIDNKRKRGNDGSTDHISSIGESNINSRGVHDSQPISSEKSSYKRQGYYYAHSHQHDSNNGVTANKRRRQKEDLRYAAATIQQSLRDAGHDAHDMSSILQNRRERALPMGSVDMSTVKIVTSAKFDSEMNDGEECLVVDEEEQDDNMIDGQSRAGTKKSNSDVDQEEEYNTVSSMYMLSSLIQSTRQYYSFSSDDTKTTRATGTSSSTSLPPIMNNQNFSNNHEKSLPRSDSSEGLSSWTPLSSENDLNDDGGVDNDDKKKDIDNDNRSDGQSSDMDDTSASSSTSNSEGETSSGSDGVVKEDNMGCINWDGAYSTIG